MGKKKRYAIISFMILGVLIGIVIFLIIAPKGREKETMSPTVKANEKIQELIQDEKFKQADFKGRYQQAQSLLDALEEEGLIDNYDYSKESEMFVITFPDDSHGGVKLKDFEHRMNKLDDKKKDVKQKT